MALHLAVSNISVNSVYDVQTEECNSVIRSTLIGVWDDVQLRSLYEAASGRFPSAMLASSQLAAQSGNIFLKQHNLKKVLHWLS